MRRHSVGYRPSGGSDGDTALSELHSFEAALHGPDHEAGETDTLAHADELADDIAEIERAATVLRKAEPALEAWTDVWGDDQPAAAPHKARPVWLLIGFLWLSTALVTIGAVAAIARLVG